jgi:hypothetical protein
VKKSEMLLQRMWCNRIGQHARCAHTGRVGKIVNVYWRNREACSGDWGVFVEMRDSGGYFTGRPAFLELTTEAVAASGL